EESGAADPARTTLEAALQPNGKLHRLSGGEALGQVRPDLPGIESHSYVERPLAQNRNPVDWHLARPITSKPGLAGVAQKNQICLFDADEPAGLVGPAFRHSVSQIELQAGTHFHLGGDRPVAQRRLGRIVE